MGSFSWEYAEKTGRAKNIEIGAEFKFLVPEQFGGGSIDDSYRDYGYLGELPEEDRVEPFQEGAYDMYELQAIMNKDMRISDLLEKKNELYDRAFDEHTEIQGLGDIKLDRELFTITGIRPEYLEDEKAILEQNPNATIGDLLKGNIDEFPKKIDENTNQNRNIGIDLSCYDGEGILLDYPLKLVRPSYKGTYEECKDYSKGDREQGWRTVNNTKREMKKWERENPEYMNKYINEASLEKD